MEAQTTKTDRMTLWVDERLCSPWSLSVWVVLTEKELDFRIKPVPLRQASAELSVYQERVFTGKVPALETSIGVISESLAIVEYLEEKFPPPAFLNLLPVSLEDRAFDRQLLSWLRSDLFELRRCLPFEGILLPINASPLTDRARMEASLLIKIAMERLDRRQKAGHISIADIELGLILKRLVHYEYDLSQHACRVPHTRTPSRPRYLDPLGLKIVSDRF